MRGIKSLPRPCPQCGTLFQRPDRAFCSATCAVASKSRPPRHCRICEKSLGPNQELYCSRDCTIKGRFPGEAPKCRHCRKPVPMRRTGIYCCVACRYADTPAPPAWIETARDLWGTPATIAQIGVRCGVGPDAVARWARRLKFGVKTSSPASRPSLYTAEQDAIVRRLYPTGTFEYIQREVNAAGSYQIRDLKQLGTLAKRLGVKRSVQAIRAAASAKARAAWAQRPAPAARPSKPPPIPIRLREVYQWGFTLDVPRRLRGDIAAVSRAARKDDPTHPGFVLASTSAGLGAVRMRSGLGL